MLNSRNNYFIRRFSSFFLSIVLFLAALGGCVSKSAPPQGQDTPLVEEVIAELAKSEYRGRLVGSAGNEKSGIYIASLFEELGLEPLYKESFFWGYSQTSFNADIYPRLILNHSDGTSMELIYGTEFTSSVMLDDINATFEITTDLNDPAITEKMFLDTSGDVRLVPQIMSIGAKGILMPVDEQVIAYTGSGSFPISCRINSGVHRAIEWDNVENATIIAPNMSKECNAANIVGCIRGKDSKKAVIVSAHFDGSGGTEAAFTTGSLDNASGVAAMLRMAEIITEAGQPETDIIFAALNGEETGPHTLNASEQFIKELTDSALYNELFNINIDCVGYDGDNVYKLDQRFSLTGSSLYMSFASLLEKRGINYTDASLSSDHMSFENAGIPSMLVSTLDSEGQD
jgi:hypothetical protein